MSTTPSPPTYTREQQIAALTKATVASHHPDNQKKLLEDVNNLVQKLKDVRDGFSDAGIALDKVDKAKGPDGKALNDTGKSFFDQWNALSKQFDNLLTQSCEVAGNIGGQCMGFNNAVLKFVANPKSLTPHQLIELVERFIKGLNEDQEKIVGFENQFTALSTHVQTFADTVNAWATQRLNKPQKDLQDLKEAVQKAQNDIYDLQAKIGYVGAGIGVTLWLAIATYFFCPFFTIALGIVGFPGEIGLIISYETQIKAEQAKIDGDNKKIADLSKEIQLVQNAQSEMDTVNSTNIKNIVAALKSFRGIWDAAHGDGADILGYLQVGQSLPPPALAVYLEKESSLYTSFGNAMLSYARLQTSSLIDSGVDFEPRPAEERLWSLVELGKIHPLVNEVIQDILKSADLRVRV